MKQFRYLHIAAFVSLVAAFIAIRFWNLTESCLWFDEIFSVHAATQSWDSLLSFVALDLIHPPLFYVLLKLWIGVGGEGLFWLRLFPVVFSVIAIFPFVALCRELKLTIWTQVLAVFLFAVNGSLIKYAQEVRMYSFLLCVSVFSMWLFVRFRDKGKSFVPLILVNIILVYTHYFGWFVVVSEVAAIAIFQRIKLRQILTMTGLTLVSFLPWAYAIWSASRSGSGLGQNIGWMTRPGLRSITQLVLNLIEPFYYQASTAEPISLFRISLPVLLILGLALIFLFSRWNQLSENNREILKSLSIFVVVPLGIAFAASWLLPYSIWGTRHLIIVFAPVLIIVALAVTSIANARVKTGAVTLILLFSSYAFVLQASRPSPQYIWCAWEKLAEELILAPHYSPERKRVYVFEDLVAYHFWFGLRKFENYDVRVVKGIEGARDDPAYFLPRGFNGVQRLGEEEISDNRIWIAFREPKTQEPPGLAFMGQRLGGPVKALAERGFEVEDVRKLEIGDQVAFLVLMLKNPKFNSHEK
jgi:uncharacterized membrane protein